LIVLPVAGFVDVNAIIHLSLFDFSLEQKLSESTSTAGNLRPAKSKFLAFAARTNNRPVS
jgi:hypothetical protein